MLIPAVFELSHWRYFKIGKNEMVESTTNIPERGWRAGTWHLTSLEMWKEIDETT